MSFIRRAWGAALCLVLAACPKAEVGDTSGGTDSQPAPSMNCSPLDGTYRFTYAERSGDCGPQPQELLRFVNGRSIASPSLNCQAGGEAMVSRCDLQRDSTCAVSDPNSGALVGHIRVVGVLSELVDNSRVEGTLDVAIVNTTGGSCESSYDVVGIRGS
jgi:hypothetical protein